MPLLGSLCKHAHLVALQAKDLVLQAMQPSEDMVAAVTSNATLLQGKALCYVKQIHNSDVMRAYQL
jgi:hypothetical protein